MGDIRMTRDFFLWCMATVYLFAFGSLYAQLPGLYGDDGILPARLVLKGEATSVRDLVENQPSLLRLLPRLGIGVTAGMDLLCVAGIVFSFIAMTTRAMRNCLVFLGLWVFYLSLFKVGQTFLWFQWDTLLLEAGFLCVLLAPLRFFSWRGPCSHQHDRLTLWLVRWLLFRLMFASGVVKLTSKCPTWWGLTAMNYHYETQCIPTPLAWFFHQLPDWWQKLSVASCYLIEIAAPFLFFSPVRGQRLVAFYLQVLLQLLIILTGNYNFFNLLTITLCLSLVDDNFLCSWMGKRLKRDNDDLTGIPIIGSLWWSINRILNIGVFGAFVYAFVTLFHVRVVSSPKFRIDTNIEFTEKDLDKFLQNGVPISMAIGAISLSGEFLRGVKKSLVNEKGGWRKIQNLIGCAIFGAVAAFMFSVSLVDLTMVEAGTHRNLPATLHRLHEQTNYLTITNSYGLFRTMTGVGGRPEVIIEGSNSMDAGWKEYNFLYKPGNVSTTPSIVAPHQPRLDWQMWFAALGSYNHNPWFLNLCYRILTGQKEVLQLMGENPYPEKPPTYLRATLYHYHFTSNDVKHQNYDPKAWWVRTRVQEYLPVITKDDPSFVNYLKDAGIYDTAPKKKKKSSKIAGNFVVYVLDLLRGLIGQPEGFTVVMSLFVTAVVLTFLDPSVRLYEWND